MKPDWKDAPEWANWLAMDKDGAWYWYEEMPNERAGYEWRPQSRFERIEFPNWRKSLEARP